MRSKDLRPPYLCLISEEEKKKMALSLSLSTASTAVSARCMKTISFLLFGHAASLTREW